jgi:hypothetical protein
MTKMQKIWTLQVHRPKTPVVATPIEDRIKRRPEAKRTRQRLNREFGLALALRGAARKARLLKLAKLAGEVPGYAIPQAAQDALSAWTKKEEVLV